MSKHLHVVIFGEKLTDVEDTLQRLWFRADDSTWYHVTTLPDLHRYLCHTDVDCIVVDSTDPCTMALEALKVYYASGLAIPVLLISGPIDAQQTAIVARPSIQHRIVKDTLERLVTVIEQDVLEKEHAYDDVEHDASRLSGMGIGAVIPTQHDREESLSMLEDALLTPLTCILGWAQAAYERPDMIPQALTVIEEQAQRQHRMIRQVLDLVRNSPESITLGSDLTTFWQEFRI